MAEQVLFAGLIFGVSNGNGGDLDRKRLVDLIVANGGKVCGLVHKRVSALVADKQAVKQNTQRVRKAVKFGIPIVSEQDIIDSVENNRPIPNVAAKPTTKRKTKQKPDAHPTPQKV
eukprot:c56871_g1_i1.p1 GENE.c56871_g1_i1~~c56871_g1_i1.p1  ORF type:complete len:116 (+),score=30.27 c56871_g1_i1:64-411(+)